MQNFLLSSLKKRSLKLLHLFLLPQLLALNLSGCKSVSITELYQSLDGEQKQIFLRYYPDLTTEERSSYLTDPHSLDDLLPDQTITRHSPLLALSILPLEDSPITQGTELPLKVMAHFANGKKVDVTSEVRWQVLPPLAQIENSTLSWKCLASDLVVSAHFLEEFQIQKVFHFQKKVQSLSLINEEHYSKTHHYEFNELKLIAKCEDGTRQEVSCQAQWKTAPGMGEFSGCGNFTPSRAGLQRGSIPIEVHYSNQLLKTSIEVSGLFYR